MQKLPKSKNQDLNSTNSFYHFVMEFTTRSTKNAIKFENPKKKHINQ